MKLIRLEIRHLPGIDSPFAVDLAPNTVNLVTGPNGSGKSSLVRAVRALLHVHREDPHIEVSAVWEDGDGALSCERSGHSVQWRRRGRGIQPPRLPGPEAIGAYLISTEDLSGPGQTDAHIAGELQTLLAGGYDLDAVLAASPFSPPARPQKLARDIDSLQRAIADKEAEYTSLYQDTDQLRRLENELRQATRSAALLGAVDDALQLADAHSSRSALETTLIEEFPGGMDRLHGDEIERLDQAYARLEQRQQAIRMEQEALARERDELDQSGGVDPADLEAMQAQLADARDALAATEQQLHACSEQLALAEQAAEQAARRLGSADPEHIEQLDQPALEKLERQVEKVLDLREKIRALTGQLVLTQSSRNPSGRPQGDLRTARSALQQWLALARLNPLEGVLWTSLGLAALLGSSRILSSQSESPPELLMLMALAVGLPVAMLVRFLLRLRDREAARQRYCETAIEPPLGWSESEARKRLERLDGELEAATQHEISQVRAAELRDQLNAQRASLERSRDKLKQLADHLGIAADPRLETGFLLWCRHLQDWQREHQRLNDQRLRQDTLNQRLARQNDEAMQLLERHGAAQDAISSRTLAALVHQLQPRIRRHSELHHSIQARERRLRELEADLAQVRHQLRLLFEGTGIAQNDIRTLRRKAELYPTWQQLEQQRREFGQEILRLEKRLEDHPELVEPARHQRRQALEALRREYQQRAAQRDAIHERITEIRTRHAEALKRRELEQLGNELEQLRERLAIEFDAHMVAGAGQHLIEQARSAYRTEHEPALLAAADRWLDSFTRHRYRLAFQDGQFQAIDARSGRRQAVGELSTGTRAQFMLAVRLAWIEQQEQRSEPLPVFMDEVLTTSDADRYRAVVGAVRTLIDNGRQLLYLTAQSDDAQAWREWLGDGLDPHTIDMTEVRRGTVQQLEFQMPDSAARARALPQPDDMDPVQWARAVHVDAIDPWQDSGQVHVAHLLNDDLTRAYRLLGLGVERLGELERLIERLERSDGAGALDLGDFGDLQARVQGARMILDDWRRHHCRPVDAAGLQGCGLITERFLPQVVKLAEQLDGDPVRLIDQLGSGAVPRFRSDVTSQLCDWLKAHDYWHDESGGPALTAAELVVATGLEPGTAHGLIDSLASAIINPLAGARDEARSEPARETSEIP